MAAANVPEDAGDQPGLQPDRHGDCLLGPVDLGVGGALVAGPVDRAGAQLVDAVGQVLVVAGGPTSAGKSETNSSPWTSRATGTATCSAPDEVSAAIVTTVALLVRREPDTEVPSTSWLTCAGAGSPASGAMRGDTMRDSARVRCSAVSGCQFRYRRTKLSANDLTARSRSATAALGSVLGAGSDV